LSRSIRFDMRIFGVLLRLFKVTGVAPESTHGTLTVSRWPALKPRSPTARRVPTAGPWVLRPNLAHQLSWTQAVWPSHSLIAVILICGGASSVAAHAKVPLGSSRSHRCSAGTTKQLRRRGKRCELVAAGEALDTGESFLRRHLPDRDHLQPILLAIGRMYERIPEVAGTARLAQPHATSARHRLRAASRSTGATSRTRRGEGCHRQIGTIKVYRSKPLRTR